MLTVFGSQDYFWRSIKSTLNVSVNSFVFKATRTEIDHLNTAAALLLEEDIFCFLEKEKRAISFQKIFFRIPSNFQVQSNAYLV